MPLEAISYQRETCIVSTQEGWVGVYKLPGFFNPLKLGQYIFRQTA